MSRKLGSAIVTAVCLVAAYVGHLLADNAPPPNGFICDGNTPRNCYCRTTGNSSCYSAGGEGTFYTCWPSNAYCDGANVFVTCVGSSYSGVCQGSGGPGPGQVKGGPCNYAEYGCALLV